MPLLTMLNAFSENYPVYYIKFYYQTIILQTIIFTDMIIVLLLMNLQNITKFL